eukprot:TRINITY_DN11254_c0_g1_i1.p1 TRINITY_DN11254_c0_g1~~TRINITY_DN11254_c0_g1_i1.p1  ORF type:complete len:618 (-),score=127.34 TRINITY_DN11254_c0_g1_i1:94-1947(-)
MADNSEKSMCVQCKTLFPEDSNTETSCMFHSASYDSWNRSYSCCGSRQMGQGGCCKNKHRSTYHCDYPYGEFFKRAWDITGYTDTRTEWGKVSDKDFLSGDEQQVHVGRLNRWQSRAQYIKENLLLVHVGRVSPSHKYWFLTYSEKDLDEIGKSGKVEIFRNSESKEQYSLARWIITDGMVTGIHIEAKASTSTKPSAMTVKFTPFPLTFGEAVQTSKGGIAEYKPESEYTLPEKVDLGAEIDLSSKGRTKARSNFPNQGNQKNIKIKVDNNTKVAANPRHLPKADIFESQISLINTSKEPLVIVEAKCDWRLVGNSEWKSVDEFHINTPFTLDAVGTAQVHFSAVINDETKDVRWFDRSWIARKQPLRLRVTFEDSNGLQRSQVLEYVFAPYKLDEPKEDDLLFVKVDNPDKWDRDSVRVRSTSSGVVDIDGNTKTENDLRGIVFKAMQDGVTEVLLFEREKDNGTKWKSFALIDLNCNRVYAVKVVIWNDVSSSVGYAKLPLYGDVSETKPNSPAKESFKSPDVPTPNDVELVLDDTLDDNEIPITLPSESSSGSSTQSSGVVSLDSASLSALNSLSENVKKMSDALGKLETMDKNVARLADTFERLVAVLEKKQ